MVKTFVEGQGSMIDSLEEMIDRQSQEQVSQLLFESIRRNLLYVRCTMYLETVFREPKTIRKPWQETLTASM